MLQQEQAWEYIQQTDTLTTSHLIKRENGGRRVAITFRCLTNNWEQVVIYAVEIQIERLSAEKCLEEIEQGRVFIPLPLKQAA